MKLRIVKKQVVVTVSRTPYSSVARLETKEVLQYFDGENWVDVPVVEEGEEK